MHVPVRFFWWGAWLALTVFAVPLSAQIPEEENNDFFRSGPLERLPKNIHVDADRLSLFADFEHGEKGSVWIYLVNATANESSFLAQGNDLYCKRETKTGPEKWERCDTHQYSGCGNAYGRRSVPAGSFYAWKQRLDTAGGVAQAVRFHLYQPSSTELTSNEGTGLVGDGEVSFCRHDAMAMEYAPFEVVAGVATGRSPAAQGVSGDEVSVAISSLARFSKDRRLFPVLQEILAQLPGVSDNRIARDRYDSVFAVLARATDASVPREDAWKLLTDCVQCRSRAASDAALDTLINPRNDFNRDDVRKLVDSVLDDPAHPSLLMAIGCCAKVYDKAAAGARLSRLMNDPRLAQDFRSAARRNYEELFENPFIKIETENGEGDSDGRRPTPLKRLKISNTSPQSITLGEDSLVLEITADGRKLPLRVTPFQVWLHGRPLLLKAGESVEWKNVAWWELAVPSEIKSSEGIAATFSVQLPALWEIPARAPWQAFESGEKILGMAHGAVAESSAK